MLCFSQGSVATYYRSDGKYDTDLVENLQLSLTVKYFFFNRPSFLNVMNAPNPEKLWTEYRVARFYGSRCTKLL